MQQSALHTTVFLRSCRDIEAILAAPGVPRRQLADALEAIDSNRHDAQPLRDDSNFIALTGIRGAGKTVLCHQVIRYLVQIQQVDPSKILYLNLGQFPLEDSVLEALLRPPPGQPGPFKFYFLDGLETFSLWLRRFQLDIKYLENEKAFQVIFTSRTNVDFLPNSRKRLGKLRTRIVLVKPFSFPEFNSATKALNLPDPLGEYLFWGGFPAVTAKLVVRQPIDALALLKQTIYEIFAKDIFPANPQLAEDVEDLTKKFQKMILQPSIRRKAKNFRLHPLHDALATAGLLQYYARTPLLCVIDPGFLNAYLCSPNQILHAGLKGTTPLLPGSLPYEISDRPCLHPSSLQCVVLSHIACQGEGEGTLYHGFAVNFPFGHLMGVNEFQRYQIFQTRKEPPPTLLPFLNEACARIKSNTPLGYQLSETWGYGEENLVPRGVLGVIGMWNAPHILSQDPKKPPIFEPMQNLASLVIPTALAYLPLLDQYPNLNQFHQNHASDLKNTAIELQTIYISMPQKWMMVSWFMQQATTNPALLEILKKIFGFVLPCWLVF